MSIGKRIEEAIDKMVAGDFEGALIPASIVVDATASQEYPNMKSNAAYKNFIHHNFAIISKVCFGNITIGSLHVKYDHPDIVPDPDGTCSVEQIFYHVVRCGLLHKARLPLNLKFVNKSMIKVDHNLLILPSGLIYGLIAAVVVSPVNQNESVSENHVLNIGGHVIRINEIWGKKDKLLKLYSNQIDDQAKSQRKQMIIGGMTKPEDLPFGKKEENAENNQHRKKWYQSRIIQAALISASAVVLVSAIGWFITFKINKSQGEFPEVKKISLKEKLPISLSEICQDIDSRPLVQQNETAKRYIGIKIEKERLKMVNVHENSEEGTFTLVMILPDQPDKSYITGRQIFCTVKKDQYPELNAAKEGLELYVSGQIEEAGGSYIRISNVSLKFD